MILNWKIGLIGLSLGVLSACSGADEGSNVVPTPERSATAEVPAPADIIPETEAIVAAAEDTVPAASADVSIAEPSAEAIAETLPDAAAAEAEAERVETARIAAEAEAQEAQEAEAAIAAAQAREAKEAEATIAAAQAQEAREAEAAIAAAQAQEAREAEAAAAAVPADGILTSGTWTKKKRTSKGTWSITREGGELFVKLDDDFSTRNAPDLKIFLSPLSAAEAANANATDGALLISLLSSNKGAQSYMIPSGTDLANYQSILIHCEDYTILWSAADL
ncbi:MAG: DM13 domain-containing protein [Hyphomonadaceae bacterium]